MFPSSLMNVCWNRERKKLEREREKFAHGIYSVSRQFGVRLEMPLMPFLSWYLLVLPVSLGNSSSGFCVAHLMLNSI